MDDCNQYYIERRLRTFENMIYKYVNRNWKYRTGAWRSKFNEELKEEVGSENNIISKAVLSSDWI